MFLCHPVFGQRHVTDTAHLFQQEPEIQLAFLIHNHVSIKMSCKYPDLICLLHSVKWSVNISGILPDYTRSLFK
jgi:hypothetical protein